MPCGSLQPLLPQVDLPLSLPAPLQAPAPMAFPMTTPQVPVYGMVSLETRLEMLREVILLVVSNVCLDIYV